MELNELLSGLTGEELRDIARTNNIRGFAKLSKDALVGLISQSLYTDEISLKEVFNKLPDSQKYFLTILVKKTNGIYPLNDI